MKLFRCQTCANVVYFENRTCGRCGHTLGYLPELQTLSALEPEGEPNWKPVVGQGGPRRFCANVKQDACNWLTPPGSDDAFCLACRHNDTIPDLSAPGNLQAWRDIELDKHRLFYSLLRWELPLKTRAEDPEHGLVFRFLADPHAEGPKAMTGHDNGVITLALAEADPAERERRRSEMAEPYRTLLGHFRHEVGHYYWDLLVRDGGRLEAFRQAFGDERADYAEALRVHYQSGPPADWAEHCISAYASSHPWEDFAETWAHYLHIVDTLDTARAFGLRIRPETEDSKLRASIDFDPYAETAAEMLIEAWLPLTFAVNSLNRSMGQPDLYPFVLPPPVIAKLRCIALLVHGRGAASSHPSAPEPATAAR